MKVLERTQRLLAKRLGVDESELTPDRTLESLGIDSLARLELLFELEEAFGVRLHNDAAKLITLGHVVALVESQGETK